MNSCDKCRYKSKGSRYKSKGKDHCYFFKSLDKDDIILIVGCHLFKAS